MSKKRVWLNTVTGKFSNSWDYPHPIPTEIPTEIPDNWKLIEYEVLNDKEFEFKNYMGLR
jgi:hypothetical protein